MKRKLFSLVTLLLCAVTGAWAQTTLFDASNFEDETLTSGSVTKGAATWYGGGSAAYDGTGKTIGGVAWTGRLKFGGNSTFQSGTAFARLIAVDVASAGTIKVYFLSGSKGKTRSVYVSKAPSSTNRDTGTAIATASDDGSDGNVCEATADVAGTYYIWCTENIGVYGVTYESSTPSLSGTWTPTSGTIYKGDAVPTPSFSVTASDESTPSASDYNVVYSVKAGSTDGMITIPAGGASFTLNNSIVGEATLVATLSSTDDDKYVVTTSTYEFAYEVKAKTPAIELTETSVTLKSTPVLRNATATVTLTGAFLTGASGTVTWDAVDGLTITPNTFDITSGAASQTFTISYNKDAATSGSVDVTFSDGATSEVLTVDYSSVVAHDWVTVSESTTWDWSKLSTSEVKLTGETTPTKSTEFLLGDMNGENYTYNIGYDPATFNADALKVITEYVVRDNAYMQGTSVKFKTSKPGTVKVTFSNTGGNRPYRYVMVNGAMTTTGSDNATFIDSDVFSVPAGEVTITGYIPNATDPTPRKDDVVGSTMLRISKIVFTADDGIEQESVEITCEGGLASYSNATKGLDFSTSTAKAYIVTAASNTSATLTEVTKAPAGTGLIILGSAKGETLNVLTTDKATAADVDGNLLVGTGASGVAVADDAAYILSKTDGKFHLVNAGTIPAGKAYLPAGALSARSLDLSFGENGETTGITTVKSEVKNVEGIYNLNGQRVAMPTKGLYIVNGKKVIIK